MKKMILKNRYTFTHKHTCALCKCSMLTAADSVVCTKTENVHPSNKQNKTNEQSTIVVVFVCEQQYQTWWIGLKESVTHTNLEEDGSEVCFQSQQVAIFTDQNKKDRLLLSGLTTHTITHFTLSHLLTSQPVR